MKGDKIGECVSVLFFKRWGKTPIDKKLRSKTWWENKLKELINEPSFEVDCEWTPGIYNQDGTAIPNPPRYEDEYQMSYEQQTKS